jgi:glutathione synthetase
MQHEQEAEPKLLQVELNTIAAAFAGLAPLVSKMHSFLAHKIEGCTYSVSGLPENVATEAVTAGLAKAWSIYDNPSAVVMMVVQPEEKNSFDQRRLEYQLWEKYGITTIRRTLTDIGERASLVASTNDLSIDGKIVAITYFRAGYTPKDYPSEKEWQARLLIERSSTVSCPSIPYHLVGAKKVQQVFSLPGVLEKFFGEDTKSIEQLRACFAALYSLDIGECDNIVERAISTPEEYVMKPQREGGGNNLYGEELKQALQTLNPKERAAYILMQRIRPKACQALVMKRGSVSTVQAISELGIYSVYLRHNGKEILNEAAGHLLRTKTASSNEGGVAAGFAVLDSPLLIP